MSPAHIDINTGFRQLRQYVLAVAAIGRKDISDAAVTRKGLYGAFGHDVDRERRRQCLDVKDVGGGRVLGTCARPSRTLRPGAFVKSPHLRIPDVRTGCECHRGDLQFVGTLRQVKHAAARQRLFALRCEARL